MVVSRRPEVKFRYQDGATLASLKEEEAEDRDSLLLRAAAVASDSASSACVGPQSVTRIISLPAIDDCSPNS